MFTFNVQRNNNTWYVLCVVVVWYQYLWWASINGGAKIHSFPFLHLDVHHLSQCDHKDLNEKVKHQTVHYTGLPKCLIFGGDNSHFCGVGYNLPKYRERQYSHLCTFLFPLHRSKVALVINLISWKHSWVLFFYYMHFELLQNWEISFWDFHRMCLNSYDFKLGPFWIFHC